MLERISHSPEETKDIANQLAGHLKAGMVISLKGDLGAGKTTFTQGLAKALGITGSVKSPTYTIVKQYPLPSGDTLNHIDAYRLEEGGADTVDLDSFFTPDAITLIEWADFVQDYLPPSFLELEIIQLSDSRRQLLIHAVGEDAHYTQLLQTIQADWKG